MTVIIRNSYNNTYFTGLFYGSKPEFSNDEYDAKEYDTVSEAVCKIKTMGGKLTTHERHALRYEIL